jgi:tripartite-type tricarboxylate transporter receptor subunit TctC
MNPLMITTQKWLGAIGIVFTLAGPIGVLAQSYPDRPVKIIVGFAPGGSSDTVARLVAQKLTPLLGQPVVVENRPGSNGNLSSELTARAAPDGYTLLLAPDSQIVINPHLYAKMPLDTVKDLLPVATVVSTQLVLAVNPSLPVKTLPEFVEFARRAHPPLAYASIGNGSQHHLTMEMLRARAGIDLVHVPYKGGGPATMAILGGEVSAMVGGNSVAAHIRAGKLRAIALAGRQRSASYPDVPTMGETYPGLEVTTWLGYFAPQGVPAQVLSKLRAEINRSLGEADLREKLRNVGGLDPFVTTPDEFAAMIRADFARYGQIVKAVGATVD